MAHAFNDELEKIALSKELLARAAVRATHDASTFRQVVETLQDMGIDTTPVQNAMNRRRKQATRFLGGALGAKKLPEIGPGRESVRDVSLAKAVTGRGGDPEVLKIIRRGTSYNL